MTVVCPLCKRERDRMQTFITHACVDRDECARFVRATRDEALAGGQRLYVLLALFDRRDGTALADMIQAAREGWERSHPDMGEHDAWHDFDRIWGNYTSGQRLEMARRHG